MSLTIAQLNSAVRLSLNNPDKAICDPLWIHLAVRNAVTLFTRRARESDQNAPVSHYDFTPTAQEQDLWVALGSSEIAWVERSMNGRYTPVNVISKGQFEAAYQDGRDVVATYTDETTDPPKKYITFSKTIETTDSYRIWYDKDAVLTNRQAVIILPDSLAPVLEMKACVEVIAKMKVAISSQIENEEARKLMAPRLNALDGLSAHFQLELATQWTPLFRKWKNRQRAAQNAHKLPSKTGSGFYGR
jgi:hypothetical protein